LGLPNIIQRLEGANLSIVDQRNLISEARSSISDRAFLIRFDNIFESNPDFYFFKEYSVLETVKNFTFMRFWQHVGLNEVFL
jgi:hypothetical protein